MEKQKQKVGGAEHQLFQQQKGYSSSRNLSESSGVDGAKGGPKTLSIPLKLNKKRYK